MSSLFFGLFGLCVAVVYVLGVRLFSPAYNKVATLNLLLVSLLPVAGCMYLLVAELFFVGGILRVW